MRADCQSDVHHDGLGLHGPAKRPGAEGNTRWECWGVHAGRLLIPGARTRVAGTAFTHAQDVCTQRSDPGFQALGAACRYSSCMCACPPAAKCRATSHGAAHACANDGECWGVPMHHIGPRARQRCCDQHARLAPSARDATEHPRQTLGVAIGDRGSQVT